MKKIVLASASSRRSSILSECGIGHEVVISKVEEIKGEGLNISDIVKINSEKKTEAVKGICPGSVIIGADTLVAHGKDIIGKPSHEEEARDILENFSGGKIEVYTGICLLDTVSGRETSDVDKSVIKVDVIEKEDLNKLFGLFGSYDKAGGFSIEGPGAMLFDNIKGSYFNILGLSMMKLKRMFKAIGLNILDYVNNTG